MKQIYNFEQHSPPILNENMIQARLEQRTLQQQAAALAIAGILIQILVCILGVLVLNTLPVLAAACFIYLLISTMGSAAITVIYAKGGFAL